MTEYVARLKQLPAAIGESLAGFGGFLRCETCRSQQDLPSELIGEYIAEGWPRCCGCTMHWWTQRQIDAGEVAP